MNALSLVLALVLAAWPRASMAADAGRVVGTVTIEMENKAASRKITSELWFDAATGATVASNPSSGKRPLIVISPGNFGTRFSHGWLAVPLVNSGYVVLSTSHPGTMAGDQSAAGRYRLWDRSRDV